uniref:Ionotropic glutamate receptor C-terminal domain-containing protein n=1 Tax=Anopheles atroparvus TaxID=41427 RepID=A0A182J1B5_ANOAO
MATYGARLWLILLVIIVSAASVSSERQGIIPALAEPIGALLELIGTPLKVTALVACWTEGQRLAVAQIGLRSGRHFWQFVPRWTPAFGDDVVNQWLATLDADGAWHQTMVMVDLACNGTERLLADAGQRLFLNYRWLVLDSRAFDDENAGTSSVYKLSTKADLRTEQFALWRRDDSGTGGRLVDLREKKVTSVRRKDLRGHTLRASMVITNPDTMNHLTDYKDKHIDTITKVNYLLTNILATYLGAGVNYTCVSSWGYYNPSTGMWDGMIGELVHDVADLGASPLFFTTDRIAVIEYLAMTTETRSKFIFRSPKLSYTENVFVLPFEIHVWGCVISVIVLSSVLLLVTLWAEWRVAEDGTGWTPAPPDASVLRASFRDTLLMIYGASCQQGSAVLPRSCSARTIAMLTFTVLMFLYASYSANIVALLQSPSTRIQSLEDLLASRLKFGVHDTIFNRHYFTHATERTRRALYEQKIRAGPGGRDAFIPLEQGIDRIRRGLYAFHVEQGVGYKVISETYQEDEKCGLQEIQYLQVVDPYYAIQKNSSFKEMVKIGLFRLNEHGIQYRENAKLYTKKPTCSGGGGKFVPVSLVDVEPAVWIILWGGGLAAGFFTAEFIYFRGLPRRMRFRIRSFLRCSPGRNTQRTE